MFSCLSIAIEKTENPQQTVNKRKIFIDKSDFVELKLRKLIFIVMLIGVSFASKCDLRYTTQTLSLLQNNHTNLKSHFKRNKKFLAAFAYFLICCVFWCFFFRVDDMKIELIYLNLSLSHTKITLRKVEKFLNYEN